MTRKLYLTIITIAICIILIPTLANIISPNLIPNNFINRNLIKTFLLFFICGNEINFIKNKISNFIGWTFLIFLFIGLQFKIMHWPFGTEIMMLSGIVIMLNFIVLSKIEKRKEILHYALYCFVILRLVIILTKPNEILWWTDLTLNFTICIIGLKYLLKLKPKIE